MTTDLGNWAPMAPAKVAALLARSSARWWVAGGWAVDLHMGRVTRPHADIDILTLRRDLPLVREPLRGWDLHMAHPPGTVHPWPPQDLLPADAHDVWCRRGPDEPWSLQLMVDDTAAEEWVHRRDGRIRRPVDQLSGPASTPSCPVLAPEIQLLHKSWEPRPRDEDDFSSLVPVLTSVQRTWLRRSLVLVAPRHPWLARLT